MSGRLVTVDDFLAPEEHHRITDAVAAAELRTSAEIRVHLDDLIEEDVMDHAAYVFQELGMHRTAERNGVLLYISVPGHQVAMIGDAGIHAKVGDAFWRITVDAVLAEFRNDRFAEGIMAGVHAVGEQLAVHFPRQADDRNELSDEISIRRR